MESSAIRVLIIDDDAASMSQSKEKISLYVTEEHIYTAANSVEIMRVLASTPIDLAFVDLEMPDIDGFSVADYIHEAQPRARYAFLTGHTELGAKSYDYEPLDFLTKPVNALRLKKTFERFEKSRSVNPYALDQIALEGVSGFVLIAPADILYIARENRKIMIHCRELTHSVKGTLEELEAIFGDYGLFRCHQSCLVALARVKSVERSDFGKTYYALLDSGEKIPVSRSRYAPLRAELTKYGTQFL